MTDQGNDLTQKNYDRLLAFSERVGIPTLILLLVMAGIYQTAQPVASAAVSYMDQQVVIMHKMSDDIRATRFVVERDASEKKAALIMEVRAMLKHGIDEIVGEIRKDKHSGMGSY